MVGAFSLTEALTVSVILGLMAALLLPALGRARLSAGRTACASNLRQIGIGLAAYLDDHDEIFPIAEDPVHRNPAYWLWMGRGWRPALAPYLGRENRTFWCPQDTTGVFRYEGTSYAYSMSFYHSPEQIDGMRDITDTYLTPVPSVPQYLSRVRYPGRKILVGEWLSNHRHVVPDNGWWCWDGSRNFLFADLHVEFLDAPSLLPANDGFPDPNLTRNGIRGADIP